MFSRSQKKHVVLIVLLFFVAVILSVGSFLFMRDRGIDDNSARELEKGESPRQNIAGASRSFFTIGTGAVTGVYYIAGSSMAQIINRKSEEHGLKVTLEGTGGSIHNLMALRKGALQFGIVQSDWLFHAYNGTNKFSTYEADRNLRAVFSLHPEPFTVVARKDSGIDHFTDLKEKRVNIGNPQSGQRGTMEVVMEKFGWTMMDFKTVSELSPIEQASALCNNKIDAFVYMVGHPNSSIEEALNSCDSRLVEVSSPEIDQLIEQNQYYRTIVIPADTYSGKNPDVSTFGVNALFITSTSVSETAVYEIVKAVFENFELFRKSHPAFADLRKKDIILDPGYMPLHSGAVKYYREVGLLD